MKLFYAQTSPFARKVRVLAHELGMAEELDMIEVNPWTDEGLRQANPMCQVPTLVLEDGTGVFDSPVICDFLNDLWDGKAYPDDGLERMQALKLQAIGDGICAAAVRRVREGVRPEAERHRDVIARQTTAMTAGLDMLDAHLEGLSQGFGIGQITVAVTLGYLDLRFPGDHWRQGRPQLAGWYDVVSQRPSMKATEPPQAPPG
jgi:glutathione S-transferase